MSPVNPDLWQTLSPYLDEALSLSEEERSTWLLSLRGQNPGLAEQLEKLLREYSTLSEEGFLATGPVRLPGGASLAGQTLGVYRLVSQIGQGGMGTVWLAERNDGRFERQVAVKFLNIALMGEVGEERFQREGRILGLLVDPHIAELLDAGVSQTGQPYLVLEHVEGDHIDRYCDHRKLGLRARIRLFLDVLGAVSQAHANLIVHRDLKPSNVLVRNDGQVKLLDFGIAKLLEIEGHPGGPTQLTVEGGRAMTPEYAAPEQLLGKAITTAADVYALGVLLYVLLTGQHPAGPGPRTPADLVKAVVDSEPARPSDRVNPAGTSEESNATNAARRGTTPDKLRRMLRGDLDTIVTKALKKDPAERYLSVTALADDLRRYLKNVPISARPDTLAYLATKFVRRNAAAVALATLATLLTAAGLVGTLMQARTARTQRNFALRQLSLAQATIEFNEFLLSDAAPGKSFTVEQLLGRAENILARDRTGDDTYRVGLMIAIGDQYSTLDEDAKARRVLEEAYKLSRGLGEKDTRAEAGCSLAGALARDGELVRAEALIQEGLQELPSGQQYDLDRVFCLRRGSEVAQERGDSQLGVARMQAAQRILEQSPFHTDMMELHMSIDLAEAYRVAGQNQQASSTFEQAAALLAPLGRDNTETAVVLFNDWALALDRLGRPVDAEKLYRRAIDISRGDETETAVSPMILNNYATTLRQLGRLDEAADYSQRAYSKARQAGDQVVIYQSLYVQALTYIDQKDVVRATAALAELEPILQKTLPPDSYWLGALASAKALLASTRGDFETALSLADRAVEIVEASSKAGKAGTDFLPIVLFRRSTVELEAGRSAAAGDDARRALTLLQAAGSPGASSCVVGRAYLNLGRALQLQSKKDKANDAFHSAAEHLQNTLGPDNPDTRKALLLAAVAVPGS
jgi:eukaryotic-like serine/threonine-protein kinase